jgi:hypothetical protein
MPIAAHARTGTSKINAASSQRADVSALNIGVTS